MGFKKKGKVCSVISNEVYVSDNASSDVCKGRKTLSKASPWVKFSKFSYRLLTVVARVRPRVGEGPLSEVVRRV